jgi:hypothetical protein
MDNKVKSGKEILEDFFINISKIENVDSVLAESLVTLYQQGKLTDTNLKNELQKLRVKDANQN